ncbi:LPS export ABC transporter permease LptF [Chelativorans salis]|uniref:LPS export ABC transporter permease LptF n=1 Tax=Chelativorans salis TaxID=2978478 RepID=A0ABT2LMX9_9HYPH|nr:LPS export ABC transporter permease LptF [Chelativorans sp. EGI FJ00035]MCT7375926.1 LPS export ABC transporter permease LptF [Chelativorans sp. EGI FJ00035]
MKVIELYILRRTLSIFAAALAWVLLIVWTTQVLNRIDLVTSSGQSAATFFVAGALTLPAVIPIVMPFAIGIAVAQTLATMNTDSELVVISAAGSPRHAVIRPILLIAIATSIAAFAISNTLEPYSRQALRQLLASANADLISTVLQEGSFQKMDDGVFVQISERLPDGQLGGIFVADTREKGMKLIYHARRGITVEREGGSILVMQDGEVQRQSENGDVSVIRFEAYAFDLSQFTRGSDTPTLYRKDRYLTYLLNPDPNDKAYATNPQSYRAELHKRLTDWLYPIVFALIGIAVAGDARSFREARVHPMITTLAIGLLVRWVGFYASNQAETKPFFVFVLYAVPIGMMVICTGFIATNRMMELPTSWTEKLSERLQSVREDLSRRFGWARRRA